MRHNKMQRSQFRLNQMSIQRTILSAMSRVEILSPWLAQILLRRAGKWSFWGKGLELRHLTMEQVAIVVRPQWPSFIKLESPLNRLALAGEVAVSWLVSQRQQELAFNAALQTFSVDFFEEIHPFVEIRFAWTNQDWDQVRRQLTRDRRTEFNFVGRILGEGGRQVGETTLRFGFELENLLPA